MQLRSLPTTALAAILASWLLAGTVLAGTENKPAKISWTPSRVVNENMEDGGFVVEVSADKEVLGAQLWVSGSLADTLEWDPMPFDILEGATIEIPFTLLQTPDEAGRTLGGTVHLRAGGKNLAKPLNLNLKKTSEGEDPADGEEGEDEEGEDGIIDDDGNLPVSWLAGEEEEQAELTRISSELFNEEGLAQVYLLANRPLENVQLWLTPSLRNCVMAHLPEDLVSEEGVLEVDDQGRIVLLAQNTQVPVILELVSPLDGLGSCGGTLHVRSFVNSKRTWPAVLGFGLGEADEEEQEEVAPSAIVDGANFKLGPVAPGQIISIFGSGIAPEELTTFEWDGEGTVPEDLSGIIVLADGHFMPLLAAGRGQINAVVPAHVKGHQVDFVVINKGKASAPMTVDLKKVVPRVFSAFGSGAGQAAAVNPSGVLNGGASPASVGGYLSLWVTGLADTSAPGFDPSAVATEAVPLPFPIRVYVGGQQQILLYAGTAPGMLQAVTQINIEIAEDTPSGPQPVLIVVGAEQSPTTTTVTVE